LSKARQFEEVKKNGNQRTNYEKAITGFAQSMPSLLNQLLAAAIIHGC
jgi:hypothetical protein